MAWSTPLSVMHCLPFVLVMLVMLMLSTLSAAHQPSTESSQPARSREDGGTQPAVSSSGRDPLSSVLMAVIQQQSYRFERLEKDLKQQETKNERLESDLKRLERGLTSFKAQQASTNKRVQDDLTTLQTDSHQSVAFTVRISLERDNGANGLTLGQGQTVVFDDVITNLGHAYDPRHGIFTAPANGTYVFSLSTMSVNTGPHLYLDVVKNGNTLDRVFGEAAGDNYDQSSSLVTTRLTTGDHVWVRQYHGNAVRGDFWTVFSGFRLR